MIRKAKPASQNSPPRRLRRGWLSAAFAAATLGTVGIGAGYLQDVTVPYADPRAAEIYNIPDADCAAAVQNYMAHANIAAAKTPEPVLIIPGFGTNDAYMSSLHEALRTAGHATYGWAQGLNTGIDTHEATALGRRLRQIYEENGNQKVSIVGYSLGGVYARELARRYPDMVESVITFGSPFGMADERLADVYRAFHGAAQSAHTATALLQPPPVPTTSIYSFADKIVPWENSLNPRAPQAENLPVQAGHLRMPFDAATAKIITDRLAEPSGTWQPLATRICTPKIK